MKAAVFYGKGDIRVQNWEVKEPEKDEVMIRVMAAGVCGTDLHIFAGAKGASECFPPVVLGHEFCGVVEHVGAEVTRCKVGDHVTVDPSIVCGRCFACQTGEPHFCERYSATGVTYDGGFAEYCTVNEKQIFLLKPEVSFEEGAMCEPLGCCLHGIDRANIRTGDVALIIGGGAIGQIMLQLARLSGAAVTILSEPVAAKRELALSLGADYAFDPTQTNAHQVIAKHGIRKINAVIECVGRPDTMKDAFTYAGQGGKILLFGLTEPDCEIPFKPYEVFRRELSITASYVNPYTHGRAAELVNSGKLHLKELISDRIPLDEISRAFEIRGRNGKMIIVP